LLEPSQIKLLPYDGIVNYYGCLLPEAIALSYRDSLLNTIPWKHDETKIFGRHIITKRKAALYGDKEFEYSYSGTNKTALPWTKELLELKTMVEEVCNSNFNSCLLNLYHSGDEGMGWHSDDEKALGKNNIIASMSLGAERRFDFRHKITKEKVSKILENGSLIVMGGTTQRYWQHCLPKTKKISVPRVNLTFRTIIA